MCSFTLEYRCSLKADGAVRSLGARAEGVGKPAYVAWDLTEQRSVLLAAQLLPLQSMSTARTLPQLYSALTQNYKYFKNHLNKDSIIQLYKCTWDYVPAFFDQGTLNELLYRILFPQPHRFQLFQVLSFSSAIICTVTILILVSLEGFFSWCSRARSYNMAQADIQLMAVTLLNLQNAEVTGT